MKKFMPQVIVLSLTLAHTPYAWADISRPPPPIALGESSLVLGAAFLSLGFVLGGLWLARKIRRNRQPSLHPSSFYRLHVELAKNLRKAREYCRGPRV